MLNNGIIKSAFIISFIGHCLFLRMPGINTVSYQVKKTEDITFIAEIEKPSLLPRVEMMGNEKKLKETVRKDKTPAIEANPEDAVKERVMKPVEIEEEIKVVNPGREAMLRYQDIVKQRIEEARRYPLWAKKERIEGAVYLNFTLLSGGLSRDIQVCRSSGYRILDQEAVETIKRAEPFPSIPKEINSSFVKIEVCVVFTLTRNLH